MKQIKESIRIFLCGDVMTGRGIDQILTHPDKPELFEPYVNDAREYILLAERVNGKISYPVSMDYIWGDALTIWQQKKPDVKIINLETAITQSDEYWPYKGIHYRMNPQNISILTTAGINICSLANNHILDWGYTGLTETLVTLTNSAIKLSGAGENIFQSMQPAIFELASSNRILVFSVGTESSGVPPIWEATTEIPGIYFLSSLNYESLISVKENIDHYRKPGDLIIFSIHWGSNWGYEVSESFRYFAHNLIDVAKVDLVFGHSSHHPRPIEIYKDKLIFYGCGDFINDYEGIGGYERYRGDLTLMYFLDFDKSTLQFNKITLVPLLIRKFRLNYASQEDCKWMLNTLNQSAVFTMQFTLKDRNLVYSHYR